MTVIMTTIDDATNEEIPQHAMRWVVQTNRNNINNVPQWQPEKHFHDFRNMMEYLDIELWGGDVVEFTVKRRNY